MQQSDKATLSSCDSVEVCTIGIPAEPLDFLKRAVEAGHPRGVEVHVDEIIHNVVVENFHDDPFKLAKKRLQFF